MAGTMRAAFYLRVSTPKRRRPGDVEPPKQEQTTENQRPDLVRLAALHGFEVVREYAAHESTGKRRPLYEEMISDAKRRDFDVLLIWAIDRFGRSMARNVSDVLALEAAGVRVMSFSESWLDTDKKNPVRDLLLAIFSWIAEQERRHKSARTKAGLERVRRNGSKSGKPIGRPPRLTPAERARALEMRAAGRSVRSIAMALRCPRPTIQRALAQGAQG